MSHFAKVLVTGSGAVTGSALKRLVVERGIDQRFRFTTTRDADLTDWRSTQTLLHQVRPDAIVHLAAVSGGIGLSARYQATLLRDNVLMTLNVLEGARQFEVQKVVMTLSAGAYPTEAPLPLSEDCLHDGNPAQNNYGSSFAKRLVDPAVRAYREEHGLRAVGLIPSGIFGEDDNFHPEHAPMLPSLIRRFCEGRAHDRPIEIWGDGTPRREYTYSGDIARIFLWALEHYEAAEPLNIGSTEELSVRQIAEQVAEATGVAPERIRFNPDKPNGVLRRTTDNSRFVAASAFEHMPFTEGLRRTVAWYLRTLEKNPKSLRSYSKARSGRSAA